MVSENNVKFEVAFGLDLSKENIARLRAAETMNFRWALDRLDWVIELLSAPKTFTLLNPQDCDKKYHSDDELESENKENELTPKDFQTIITNFKQNNKSNGKLIILVRHGEGFHNVAQRAMRKYLHLKSNANNIMLNNKKKMNDLEKVKGGYNDDMKFFDAKLTDIGINQAKSLKPIFNAIANDIELVILSPMTRALQTAQYGILPCVNGVTKNNKNKNINIVVVEFAREIMNNYTCDRRDSKTNIKKQWSNYQFDYFGFESDIDNIWNKDKCESKHNLVKRARKFLNYLMNERKENIIVYSGHSAFIRAILTNIDNAKYFYPKNGACIPMILCQK